MSKFSSEKYIDYLRKQGCIIGQGCKFFAPRNSYVDLTRPYLIEIGNNVLITKGVIILTHGFEWSVLREIYKRPYGCCGPVRLGNNIFVGMNSIILRDVTIGNNVIIGAGSIVTRDIPDNVVAGGNPAKAIMSIEKFNEKVVNRQTREAKNQAEAIKRNLGREPRPQDFYRSYFYLFVDRRSSFNRTISRQIGGYEENFRHMKKAFADFDEFLQYCFDSKDENKN